MRAASWMLCLMALCAGCAQPAPRAAAKAPASPGVELVGAQFSEIVEGQRAWDLKAKRVTYDTKGQQALLYGVKARFFEDGRVVSHASSPRALFHLGDRRLQLMDGIRLEASQENAGFEAREALWLPKQARVQAQGGIRFWRGAHRLSAESLKADRAIRRVELTGGVAGKIALSPSNAASWPNRVPL